MTHKKQKKKKKLKCKSYLTSNNTKCKWVKHTNQRQILAGWIKNRIKVYAFYSRLV